MKFTDKNSMFEFSKLNKCIESTKKHGEITADDAETLSFFLDIVKDSLMMNTMSNS